MKLVCQGARLEMQGTCSSSHCVATGLLVSGVAPTKTKDRKSTRLNSSHTVISYAVLCLKKKIHVYEILRHRYGDLRQIFDEPDAEQLRSCVKIVLVYVEIELFMLDVAARNV